MNVIGEKVRILASSDQNMVGVAGKVLLETANTLVIETGGRTVRTPKSGSALLLGSGEVVTGGDMAGRLEDRWGRRTR